MLYVNSVRLIAKYFFLADISEGGWGGVIMDHGLV